MDNSTRGPREVNPKAPFVATVEAEYTPECRINPRPAGARWADPATRPLHCEPLYVKWIVQSSWAGLMVSPGSAALPGRHCMVSSSAGRCGIPKAARISLTQPPESSWHSTVRHCEALGTSSTPTVSTTITATTIEEGSENCYELVFFRHSP
ncbi:hypothetical protein E2C01_089793 [Portunus trituberculatus]|uniref:Uncharacterized protein n=1 Tax=Portunus trituberculatus TaxID=210409 RepID=A0A5B7JK35_PORTR|nr:hypothetical protein [Portunus trituberculatus]